MGRVGLAREELARLLALRHSDPHSILGAHLIDRGVIVRALRPDAERVALLTDDADRYPMIAHDGGVFDLLLADRREVFTYRLEVHHADGRVSMVREPYGFLPSLGEFDLHLWSEGSHERAWEKMGACACVIGGVAGVAFAVWAPAAAGVSVVGDFNAWDGRLHLMRVLGNSGVWEIFIPDFPAGGLYKFEIHTRDGAVLLKTDPFATATQAPPHTAAKVDHASFAFTDEAWIEARAKRDALSSPISIYEVHLGSWRRIPEEGYRPLTYRE
ncbi:MAG: GlgB N-terminal domain-containing protein, partial [Candidatus Binataceae bacterium]